MGLFDKLVRNVTSKIKSEVLDELGSAVSKTISSAVNGGNNTSAQNIQPQNTQCPAAAVNITENYKNNYPTGDAYFAGVITEDKFMGCTIERNVHPNMLSLDAHPKCFPISYLFKKNGEPVFAVLVMNSNQYRAMTAKGTYGVLDMKGIKYIRFFKGMKNDEAYVINRIKENLK